MGQRRSSPEYDRLSLPSAGATVVAAVWRGGCVERVFVPFSEVLDALDVTEINMTELPRERRAPAP